MSESIETTVLFRPSTAGMRFLPEGPYDCGGSKLSWVAIQHGANAVVGSLNLLDLTTGINRQYTLPGRPGFAFPTTNPGEFILGLERYLQLFNTRTQELRIIAGPVDAHTTGTIINDGTLFEGGLVFGCKDLRFAEKKAGLYLYRYSDRQLVELRRDQLCSNGKEVILLQGQRTLIDIDSPTKTVVGYPLDVEAGRLGEPRILVDLRDGEAFPDGMIVTPDHRSVMISFYNPNDVAAGETRQYALEGGALERVWLSPGSPRVTCPRLVQTREGVRLVVTTAAEHMTAEQVGRHAHAGCLMWGSTPFSQLEPAPVFQS